MWARKQTGFTIVELLIVVVVIAILAAITIVAYNGIQNRAKASALQSNLSQQAKKLALWKIENNEQFPQDMATAQSLGMLTNTQDVTYVSYTPSANLQYFCATAQHSSGARYSVTSTDASPVSGDCVTNLVTNTSVEANTTNLQNIGNTNDRTIARTPASDALSGGYVLRLTVGPSGGIAGYGSTTGTVPVGRYTGSLWIRSNVAVTVNPYFEGSSTRSTVTQSSTTTLTPGVWTRVWRTLDVTAAGTVKVGFLAGGTGTTAQGNYVELDGFSLVSGETLYSFNDGASARWNWEGTEHASISVGPAVQQ